MNDADAFHGIVAVIDTNTTESYKLIVQKNYHDQNWQALWSLEDSILQFNTSDGSNSLFLQSLAKSGHFHTLTQISNNQYESLWRLGKWNLKNASDDVQELDFDKAAYNCLERLAASTSTSNLFKSLDRHLMKFGPSSSVENVLPFLEIKEAALCSVKKLTVDDF